MAYKTLEKLFYADASSDRYSRHEESHLGRLGADSSVRTGIRLEHGELFSCVPLDMSVASERILRKERKISKLWNSLPFVALGASIRSLVLDEVVYSNEMEGVHSTRRQIEEVLESAEEELADLDGAAEKEHAPFLEFARLYLQLTDSPKRPAGPRDIREIFDIVTRGVLDPKDRPNGKLFRAGPVVIENSRGKVLHQGVPSEDEIIGLLQQMIDLNERDDAPSLILAPLCHFLFEYIHPFYDGNGRTGRYLLALDLTETLSQPTVLSLSRTIAENKNAYYKAFDTVEKPLNCSDATPFVLMVLDLIEQAQEQVLGDLSEKRIQLDRLEKAIRGLGNELDERARNVLFYAAQMHVFSAFGETTLAGLSEYLGVSRPTASRSLTSLIDDGYLEKISARPLVCRLTTAGMKLLGLA